MRRLANNNSFYNLSCINVSINNHIMKMVLIEENKELIGVPWMWETFRFLSTLYNGPHEKKEVKKSLIMIGSLRAISIRHVSHTRISHCTIYTTIIRVKPLLSEHLRDLPKCPLRGCKNCAMFVNDQQSTVNLYCDKVACCWRSYPEFKFITCHYQL